MPTFETTAEQREQLLTDGFVLLANGLPGELLARWRDLARQLESDAIDAHARSESLHGACVVECSAGPRLMRFDDILAVDPDAVLDLLACPAMLALAREMSGPGTVPLQLDVLFKYPDNVSVIPWHQGAPHPRAYPYLNVGIYLDDADENDGCLRYVPGTQHELQDICGLSAAHGWEIPNAVEQPAKAGDILVQDMMILHGSLPKRRPGVRRTIYVELRPAAGILDSGAQSAEWMELRRRWMGLVLRRADPSDVPANWREELPTDLGSDQEEVAAILALHEPPIPAVYCPFDSGAEDYPIPRDMPAMGEEEAR